MVDPQVRCDVYTGHAPINPGAHQEEAVAARQIFPSVVCGGLMLKDPPSGYRSYFTSPRLTVAAVRSLRDRTYSGVPPWWGRAGSPATGTRQCRVPGHPGPGQRPGPEGRGRGGTASPAYKMRGRDPGMDPGSPPSTSSKAASAGGPTHRPPPAARWWKKTPRRRGGTAAANPATPLRRRCG